MEKFPALARTKLQGFSKYNSVASPALTPSSFSLRKNEEGAYGMYGF